MQRFRGAPRILQRAADVAEEGALLAQPHGAGLAGIDLDVEHVEPGAPDHDARRLRLRRAGDAFPERVDLVIELKQAEGRDQPKRISRERNRVLGERGEPFGKQ